MKHNNEKVDRMLYTKKFLRESLLALMKEKPTAKIAPSELCRHAGMNRNTFYTHYGILEALLKSIEESCTNR
jgi:AcrR family transcriptional regulator